MLTNLLEFFYQTCSCFNYQRRNKSPSFEKVIAYPYNDRTRNDNDQTMPRKPDRRRYTFGGKTVVATCVRKGTNQIGGFPVYTFTVPSLDHASYTRTSFLFLRGPSRTILGGIEINVTQLYIETFEEHLEEESLHTNEEKVYDDGWRRVMIDEYGYVRMMKRDDALTRDNTMLTAAMDVRLRGDDVDIRNVEIYHKLLHNIYGSL